MRTDSPRSADRVLSRPTLLQRVSSARSLPATVASGGRVARQVTCASGCSARRTQGRRPYAQYSKLASERQDRRDDVDCPGLLKVVADPPRRRQGLDDIQGNRDRLRRRHRRQPRDSSSTQHVPNAAQIQSTFYDWKWGMATTQREDARLGTDGRARGDLYRPSLLKKAGLPTDRATLAKQGDLGDSSRSQESTERQQQAGNSHFIDRPAASSARCIPGSDGYDDGSGSRSRRRATASSRRGASPAGRPGKLTAGLDQFTTPWNRLADTGVARLRVVIPTSPGRDRPSRVAKACSTGVVNCPTGGQLGLGPWLARLHADLTPSSSPGSAATGVVVGV